jgi:putative N-acetyltransferase (TIGR04045 family)
VDSVISPFSTSAEGGLATADLVVTCLAAVSDEEAAIHHGIRHAVFVQEQGFFDGSDRDPRDDDPSTVKVLGLCGSVAGGAVRLYPQDEPRLWKGDRLAVLPAFRPRGLGAHLVRFAVRTAGERGGELMVAHVQPRNVAFFRKLGWHTVGQPVEYVGHVHQQMAIRLPPA